jgi:uncharacterized protein YkwD
MRFGFRLSRRSLLPVVRPERLVAVVAAVAIAAVEIGGVGAAQAKPLKVHAITGREQAIAAAVLAAVNTERTLHGRQPLHANADLEKSARRHDVAMMKADTLSHQLPGEPVFTTRIRDAGYHWRWAGENIGWNSVLTTGGALLLERLMYHEKPPNDGHRRNILSTHYRDVGIDIYLDSRHHKLWLTEDFGSR